MKERSIEILNQALGNELIAIHQYLIHSKILNEGALYKLGSAARKSSMEEMHHADKIMDRIFYMGGLPKINPISGLNFVDDPEKMLNKDLELEQDAVQLYQNSIKELETNKDFGSAEILRQLLKEEEGHVDWLEQQLSLIKRIGIDKYLEKNG